MQDTFTLFSFFLKGDWIINGIKVNSKKVVTFEEYDITKFIMLDSGIPI